VHVVAAPETFQLNVPVGAGLPFVAETVAVKVRVCPTVALDGDAFRVTTGSS
jgi:hypothetical protein